MNIALIASDTRKSLMQSLCVAYHHIFSQHTLFATGTTGMLIEKAANLHVHKYLSGRLGGEKQICAQISNTQIDMVIFLRDPESPDYARSHAEILRLCDSHKIPLATNLATAELLILALERGDLEWRSLYNPG